MEFKLVRTTYVRRKQAARAARELITNSLAGCVHIQKIRSHYRWNNRHIFETEFLLEARTTEGNIAEVQAVILASHPYETPMLEVVTSIGTSPAYNEWFRNQIVI